MEILAVDDTIEVAEDVDEMLFVVVEPVVDVEVGEEYPVEIIETVPSPKFVTYMFPF